MAKYKKTEIPQFQDLHRGTSVTIPVLINKKGGHAFDLTGYKAIFTLKAEQFDHDYDDERALISKVVELNGDDAKEGKFYIRLSSKDMWLHPMMYWFDVMLVKEHSVARIALYKVEILGGPSNMMVDHEVGDDMWMTDAIEHTQGDRESITITTALVSDPPENLIETITGHPNYLVRKLDQPTRNVQVQSYAPRMSGVMVLKCKYEEELRVSFESMLDGLPMDRRCPLYGKFFWAKKNYISIGPDVDMDATVIYTGGWKATYPAYGEAFQPHHFCDNWNLLKEAFMMPPECGCGTIQIVLKKGNDTVNIHGSYFIPDATTGGTADELVTYLLQVDWYNWIDPEILPEDEIPETNEDPTISGQTYPAGPDSVWPPELFYGTE